MRIAFVGKGGSGTTTSAAVFARYLAALGRPVVAIDADGHLGRALGADLDPARCAATSPDGVRVVAGGVDECLDDLPDGPGEYVVADLTPSTFTSGLFTRFDLTVLVTEPTKRGVAVFRQYAGHAERGGVELRVLGNRIDGCADAVWLRQQVGEALIGCVGQSAWVRAAELGSFGRVVDLEPSNLAAFDAVLGTLDAQRRVEDRRAPGPDAQHPRRTACDGGVGKDRDYSASRR